MPAESRSFGALTLSLVLHALIVAALPRLAEARREPPVDTTPDIWAGNTVDIEAPGGAVAAATPPPSPGTEEPPGLPERESGDVPREPAPAAIREPAAPQEPEPAAREPEPEQRPAPQRTPEAPGGVPAPAAPATPDAPTPEWERMFAARAAQNATPSSGSFGAATADAPVRNLAKAFTRAISTATSADRTWANLPTGNAGSVTVRILVDEEQNITSAEPLDKVVPGHLKRLIESTLRFLKSGRFSLSAAGVGAGRETLKLEVTILQNSADTDFELGFEAPRLDRPGKAYFRNWGRRFEARVTIVSSEARR